MFIWIALFTIYCTLLQSSFTEHESSIVNLVYFNFILGLNLSQTCAWPLYQGASGGFILLQTLGRTTSALDLCDGCLETDGPLKSMGV